MTIAILLGNRMNDDGTLSEIAKQRLSALIRADEIFSFDKIILSGGMPNRRAGKSEASGMAEYLSDTPLFSKLVLEDKSRTTTENALFSSKIAADLKADEVVVITSLYHMGRSFGNPIKLFERELKKYGIPVLTVFATDNI